MIRQKYISNSKYAMADGISRVTAFGLDVARTGAKWAKLADVQNVYHNR